MEVAVDPGGRQTHQRLFAQRRKPTVAWQLPNIDRPFILTSHYRCVRHNLVASSFHHWRFLLLRSARFTNFRNECRGVFCPALFGHGWKEQIFWVLQVFSALYQQQPQILTNAIWAEMHFHWGSILRSSKVYIINVLQPFRCYFLTYCSTLYLKEQAAYKHIDVSPILQGCGGGGELYCYLWCPNLL